MMKLNNKVWEALHYGEKLPRKIKKAFIGTKMSSCQLKRQLKLVRVEETFPTMYDRPTIYPHSFCPYCGETGTVGTGNRTSYPEHWEEFKCIRCRKTVGYIDNSPYHHILECVEDGIVNDKYW